MAAPITLARAEVLEVMTNVIIGLREMGTTFRAGSPLARAFVESMWLVSQEADASPLSVWEIDLDRASNAVLSFVQFRRLGMSLNQLRGVPGLRTHRRHVHGLGCDANGREDDMAADMLFELELAARLRVGFLDLRLEEPDIALVDAYSERMVIACKRVKCLGSLGNALSRAQAQTRRDARIRLAAVSLDKVCGGFVGPANELRWDSQEEFERECTARFESVLRDARHIAHERMLAESSEPLPDTAHLGVVFRAFFVGVVKNPTAIVWTVRLSTMPHPENPGSSVMLDGFFGPNRLAG